MRPASIVSALRRRPRDLTVRIALVALALVVVVGPWGESLLRATLPLHRQAYAALVDGFAVTRFGLVERAGSLLVEAASVATSYQPIGEAMIRPGVTLESRTPARTALLYAFLIAAGAVLLVHGDRRRCLRAALLAAIGIVVVQFLAVPVVLAGSQFALAIDAFAEPSLQAISTGLAQLMLHGAGYAWCALVLLAVHGTIVRRGTSPP